MQHYPESIRKLIRNLSKLPGVGEKTAERLAIYLLKCPLNEAQQLAESITVVKNRVQLCTLCYSLSDSEVCQICQDGARDTTTVCVVEQPADMISIEKSCGYNGLYHVLGGALSPMDGIGPEALRIKELMARLDSGKVKEVILATGTSVEGESTAAYLSQLMAGKAAKITRIATGVPVGGDLKYVDQMTLKCALQGRYDLK